MPASSMPNNYGVRQKVEAGEVSMPYLILVLVVNHEMNVELNCSSSSNYIDEILFGG